MLFIDFANPNLKILLGREEIIEVFFELDIFF